MFGWSQKDKNEALIRALRETSDESEIRKALQKGADPNCIWNNAPLLWVPISMQCEEPLRILLSSGADMQATDPYYSMTALHHAAQRGNTPAVEILLERGADIQAKDGYSRYAIDCAIEERHMGIAEILVAKGALAGLSDCARANIFCHAVARNADDALLGKILDDMEEADTCNDRGDTPLVTLLRADNVNLKVLDFLLAHEKIGKDTHARDGMNPLLLSVFKNNTEAAERLLGAGVRVDVRNDGRSPFHFAAVNGSIRLTKALLAAAVRAGGADAEDLGAALATAAENGHARIAELLIEAGAQVDAADKDGKTPLMKAVRQGKTAAIETLLRAGADADLVDRFNMTVFDYTVSENAEEVRDVLALYRKNIAPADIPRSAARFAKLSPHAIEVCEGDGLSLVFNFWTQQVIYRDKKNALPMAVRNFDEIQRQEAIEEACAELKAQGGNPPEIAAHIRKKPAPGIPGSA